MPPSWLGYGLLVFFVLSLTGRGVIAHRSPQSAYVSTLALLMLTLNIYIYFQVSTNFRDYESPLSLCLTAIPISLLFASHHNCLQRDLPSLPSVTNYRANGLGLCEYSSRFRLLLVYAAPNSRHLQGTTYVYVRPNTVFVKPSQINSLAL